MIFRCFIVSVLQTQSSWDYKNRYRLTFMGPCLIYHGLVLVCMYLKILPTNCGEIGWASGKEGLTFKSKHYQHEGGGELD